MLADEKEIEMVVIATPLVSHAPIAIDCLKAGKHVLCEKLMARTVGQCKAMIKAADDNDRLLAIGHQRHYSMLYANAVEIINTGLFGDIKHIRALWHRNNSFPALDKDGKPIIDPATGVQLLHDSWYKNIPAEDQKALADKIHQYRLQGHGGTDPLAVVQPHRRRPDGRTGQPPARCLLDFSRQSPPVGRHRRRHA